MTDEQLATCLAEFRYFANGYQQENKEKQATRFREMAAGLELLEQFTPKQRGMIRAAIWYGVRMGSYPT